MKKIKIILVFLLVSLSFVPVFSQNQLFLEAFEEFSTNRLWEFEEIPIDWKMEGLLQADLNEGLNYLLENNPKLAEGSFTAVIKKDSSIWQAYYYRSAARKKLKKLWYARNDIRYALKLRGDFYEGFVEEAKILHLLYDVSGSERAVNKAVRFDPSRGTAYYIKGDIHMSQNESRKSINNYRECLAHDSLFHDARIKIALLEAATKKDMTSALEHLNNVLKIDSLQKSALLFRSLLGSEKDKKQSIRDLTNLLVVSPDNLMALWYRGLFSAQLEDFERAFNDFHKVIKVTSTDDNNFVGQQTWIDKKIDLQNVGAYTLTRVYGLPEEDGLKIRQAYCQIITGDFDKSLAAIEKVSNAFKEPVAAYLKAVTYEHKGMHVKALQNYSIALGLDNQIADAYKKRGIYEQEMKMWDNSIADFTAVLKLTPDAFFTNRMRGVSYYHINRFKEAVADFNIYLRNDSSNKEVRGFRGMAFLKLNQRLDAYVDFASSDNLQGVNLKDFEVLIDSVLLAKDTTHALYCLGIVTEAAPYFTEGYVQKFKIHMARNDWQPVADDIMHALRNSRADAAKPKYSYLLTLQALIHARNRHTDDAIKTFTEAIKFDEYNDLAYFERGRIFLSAGKSSKAESDLRKASSLGNQKAKELLAAFVKN